MNNNDLTALNDQLTAMLRQLGLEWVVEPVTRQLAEGRLVVRDNVTTYKESTKPSAKYSDEEYIPSHKAKFVAIEDYTPIERTQMIVDAVQVVVDTAMMERELLTFFSSEMGEGVIPVVQFISDGQDTGNVILLPKISEEESHVFDQVVNILGRLRQEIANVNS